MRTSSLSSAALLACVCLLLSACPPVIPGCADGEAQRPDGSCYVPEATCTHGVAGSIAASCAEQSRQCFQDDLGAQCGLCLNGYKDEGGACRPVRTCAELDCGTRQRDCLAEGAHADATCGGCASGAQELAGACVYPSCSPGVEGSMAQVCDTSRRECLQEGQSASCGGCWSGYVDDLGACRAVKTCEDLGCADARRVCSPSAEHQDAACGLCRAGSVEQNGSCVAISGATCDPAPAPGSIDSACAAEHRTCSAGAPASCGGCVSGYVEDPGSQSCVPERSCAELDCTTLHRNCSDTPNGHCTDCVAGYVQDAQTGQCRPVKTCAQLSCESGQCQEATDTQDAICEGACPEGQVWNGTQCQICPACNGEGEDGALSTTTGDGYCACKTRPGYFYSVGADVGTFPCDRDGDGWLRESARAALNSTDPVILEQARCSLRTVDRFALTTEGGQLKELPLPTPLPLYESDRNDDDRILQAVLRQRGIPAYGTDRDVTAAELNRLTKLCFSANADYNDNGVADTVEYGDRPLAPNFRPDDAPFNHHAYFSELHWGSFEPSATDPLRGRYVIREKSRQQSGAVSTAREVSLGYPTADGDYWRSCTVKRDSEWNTQNPPIGMDFARQSDPVSGFLGMNHHSLFKCVTIENEPDPAVPSQVSPAQAVAQGLRLNACQASGTATTQPGNPSETTSSCTQVAAASAQPGSVFWAGIPFNDYDLYQKWSTVEDRAYVRGCVNECSERLPSCPYWDVNPVAIDCEYEADNFGKFIQCTSTEVCDGLDNNGDSQADEGNPGGGDSCVNDGTVYPPQSAACTSNAQCSAAQHQYCDLQTGRCAFTGVCKSGTTNCVSGEVQCTPTVAPASRSETCNGLDDDCDGAADENNPGGGVQDCSTGEVGACATGKLSCQNGSLSQCVQTVFPVAETCNSIDDDCDGSLNEPPPGACVAPWKTFYKDADGDGYGDRNDTGSCQCAADTTYKVENKQDCCDGDASSNPGASTPRTTANACGSFDWNCDGNITQLSSDSRAAGCGTCCSGFCCCGAATGWADSVPACGASHTWFSGSCGGWSTCPQESTTRTQTCY